MPLIRSKRRQVNSERSEREEKGGGWVLGRDFLAQACRGGGGLLGITTEVNGRWILIRDDGARFG